MVWDAVDDEGLPSAFSAVVGFLRCRISVISLVFPQSFAVAESLILQGGNIICELLITMDHFEFIHTSDESKNVSSKPFAGG